MIINNNNLEINIGDYLCVSDIPGYLMKQNENYRTNNSICKALTNVNWNNNDVLSNVKFVNYKNENNKALLIKVKFL